MEACHCCASKLSHALSMQSRGETPNLHTLSCTCALLCCMKSSDPLSCCRAPSRARRCSGTCLTRDPNHDRSLNNVLCCNASELAVPFNHDATWSTVLHAALLEQASRQKRKHKMSEHKARLFADLNVRQVGHTSVHGCFNATVNASSVSAARICGTYHSLEP